MKKVSQASETLRLEDIPNIGRSIAADLRDLGIMMPQDVRGMTPFAVYDALRGPMGQRHDPCVLDVLLAAHDFMNGAAARPWWMYTAQCKVFFAQQND